MSQSPISDFNEQAVAKYKHRWSALDRLLHADRSFSGGERHCAFLNVNGEHFVDISAVTGFDFAEDGRALATEDWDHDGDLDVWVTARTAPRVRLLENTSQNPGVSLFVRLHGNGTNTNPDAVGARCEVWLAGDDHPLTRSVNAGDSFLSQASSWLHFGLGDKPQIERVVVHWPAGKREEFFGLKNGGRYILHQGKSLAKPWTPLKKIIAAPASPLVLPPEPEQARIVLPTPLLLPLLQTNNGETIADSQLEGATLVNLWSHTCSSCLDELKEWTAATPQFKAAGLRVLALNVDQVSQPGTPTAAQKFLEEIEFPYPAKATNEDTLQRLDLFQRSFLDRWLPLPVPCSFLINSKGKAVVIYKGPASAKTVLADLPLLNADSETRRKGATPFSGRWADAPPLAGPKSYVAQLLDHKMLADTKRYYERYLAVERKLSTASIGPMVESLKTLAAIASGRGDFNTAVTHLKEAVNLVPQAADLKALLAEAEDKSKTTRPNKALQALLDRVATEPTNGKAYLDLGDAYRSIGNPAKAVESYKNALRNEPKLFVAAGRLAWILASHPSEEIREPKAALELANRLMALNEEPDPNFLDLQGIALAANGDYATAAENARTALTLLKGDSPYKKAVQFRLGLYEKEQPYYEGAASK